MHFRTGLWFQLGMGPRLKPSKCTSETHQRVLKDPDSRPVLQPAATLRNPKWDFVHKVACATQTTINAA